MEGIAAKLSFLSSGPLGWLSPVSPAGPGAELPSRPSIFKESEASEHKHARPYGVQSLVVVLVAVCLTGVLVVNVDADDTAGQHEHEEGLYNPEEVIWPVLDPVMLGLAVPGTFCRYHRKDGCSEYDGFKYKFKDGGPLQQSDGLYPGR